MQTVAPPPDQETPGDGRRLSGRIVPVGGLTAAEREGMYRVLGASFANVTPGGFRADLAEKEWVILLADAASGAVAGFSTIMRLREVVEGRAVLAFFSGDTVISPRYWGETVLPRLW
ncbi:MAG TPA: hypothetical protein VHN78_15755, partial [Chloroflexota bacterium]|nr:hypothetical protein [Chloroflexota bacterium]